eukprot:GHVS01001169.1.p1 GENE.GHVS01001169.1~~GHVS01001169.1.p1  ORF type:complete len:219 (+),score=26.65 GHVS01001169.1:45-701(+)
MVSAWCASFIGIVSSSSFTCSWGTPRQPGLAAAASATLQLYEPQATSHWTGCSHIAVVFVFHLNHNCQLDNSIIANHIPFKNAKIRVPKLEGRKLGVFATRSPHRPNPLGLSVCRISHVLPPDRIVVTGVDVIEGTPIVSLHEPPYIDDVVVTPLWLRKHLQPASHLVVVFSLAAFMDLQNIASSLPMNTQEFRILAPLTALHATLMASSHFHYIMCR